MGMITYEGWDGKNIQILDWEKLVDENGNFPRPFDPFRESHDEEGTLMHALFDEDGDLRDGHQQKMASLLHKNPQWVFTCNVAECYHAQEMGGNTKGSYPAIYYWR